MSSRQDTSKYVIREGDNERSQSGDVWQKSKDHFRIVFEHSNDAIFIIDLAGDTIVDVNPKACELLEYTREELLSLSISDIHPSEMKMLRNFASTVFNEGRGWTDELTCLTKSGDLLSTEVSASIIEFDSGRYMITLVRDITARKRAEEVLQRTNEDLEQRFIERSAELFRTNDELKAEIVERIRIENALREQEATFRQMFSNNPVPMWVFDEETLAFLAVNDAAVQEYGYSREEFLKMTIKDIRPPEEVAGLVDHLSTHQSERRRIWEWRHLRKNGSVMYVEITSHNLRFAGRQARLVLSTVITERKEAEEKMRLYAKRLEMLHELDRAILATKSQEAIARTSLEYIRQLIPYWFGGIVWIDPETHEFVVLAVSGEGQPQIQAGDRLPFSAGRIPEEHTSGEVYVVENFLEIPEPDIATQRLIDEGMRSGISVPLIVQKQLIGAFMLGLDRPGSFKPEHIEIAREVADMVSIAIQQAQLHTQIEHHATELEQRVADRTAELEAFSYSVSHDLRTPLRAIDGFSRVLIEEHVDKLDEEGRRLIQIIRNNARNMGQLIDGLLSFSRIGRCEMMLCHVNMQNLVEEVYSDLITTAGERNVEIQVHPLLPARGDRAMLRQVIINLLSNALKFTRGRTKAMIEVGAEKDNTCHTYWVKDNGVGFEQAYADKLFSVFQRLHTVNEFEGTGVGLAIAQRIISRHGGRMWAEGRVGKGATMYFTLPPGGERPC